VNKCSIVTDGFIWWGLWISLSLVYSSVNNPNCQGSVKLSCLQFLAILVCHTSILIHALRFDWTCFQSKLMWYVFHTGNINLALYDHTEFSRIVVLPLRIIHYSAFSCSDTWNNYDFCTFTKKKIHFFITL